MGQCISSNNKGKTSTNNKPIKKAAHQDRSNNYLVNDD